MSIFLKYDVLFPLSEDVNRGKLALIVLYILP